MRVDLRRRGPLRRILECLVEAHEHAPGQPLTAAEVIEFAWAGERMSAKSARGRFYVVVNSLRALGLRDILVTSREGYYLAPETLIAGRAPN